MARAAAKEAQNQLNTTNQIGAGYGANAKQLFGTLVPQAESLVNSPGFDPATMSSITGAGMGGVNAAFGSASDAINRNAALTRNPAGVNAEQDVLARQRGEAGGKEAGDIQIENALFQNQQRMAGLNLLNSMFGTNVGAQEGFYGQGVPAINAQTNASPGWVQNLTGILGAVVPKSINVGG